MSRQLNFVVYFYNDNKHPYPYPYLTLFCIPDGRHLVLPPKKPTLVLFFDCKKCLTLSDVCVCVCVCVLPPVAAAPERPGPAAHLGAQQRDGDGGGEEMSQTQLPQPLPQLEHQRQVRHLTPRPLQVSGGSRGARNKL